MIRIKVIKASQLVLGVVLALLVIVLAVLLIRFALMPGESPQPVQWNTSQAATVAVLPQSTEAAEEVAAAFAASSGDRPEPTPSVDDGAVLVVFDPPAPTQPNQAQASRGNDPEQLENEHTDDVAPEMSVEVVPSADGEPPASIRQTASPRVLIYHTHTHEAYEQVKGEEYVETSRWRTADQTHSIVFVGEALERYLTRYGFTVVHDTTDHEPPKLGTAYTRSLKTLEKYAGQFDLYIDLHRDAYSKSSGTPRAATVNGEPVARLMMLIGNGKGQEGVSFKQKPYYKENLALARQLTEQLNQIAPGICRNVMVKTGRYNQHVDKNMLLIEVGHNKNTLQEALGSMPYLAEAIDQVFRE